MVKFYLVGGSADGTIVERPKGIERIEIDGENLEDIPEVYAPYICIYKDIGHCAFAVLVGRRFDELELEIIAEKYKLPIYSTEEVTLP